MENTVDMQEALGQFTAAFQRALRLEMEAMRERLGPFEIALDGMRNAEISREGRDWFYDFRVLTPSDKLALNGECSLLHDGAEKLVTISRLEGDQLTVRCGYEIPEGASTYTLVIYPWFLYERLLGVLDSLDGATAFNTEAALRLFGKIQPTIDAGTSSGSSALNVSQNDAVRLCSKSDLAFVWGPPGTGKTTTLGHIVTGLMEQGKRILVTSTTNAAVDQVLAKLSVLPAAGALFEQGAFVRVGQTDAETFGAGLYDVLERQNTNALRKLQRLSKKVTVAQGCIDVCETMLASLSISRRPCQLDMFADMTPNVLSTLDLHDVFSQRLTGRIHRAAPEFQQRIIESRKHRLEQVLSFCKTQISVVRADLNSREKGVVCGAQVVFATMTNMYISQLLNDEQFDVVIIEEAGMATLPVVFYCAGLAREKVIAVGDPRQLPPIVQSNDPYARQAMGRSIFDVTVPDPHTSDVVVMLNTQYRMHPEIGALVSELFYSGCLLNDASTKATKGITDREPYVGQPLVVVDTAGHTRSEVVDGSYSRTNEKTARLCVQLAVDAITDGVVSVAIITPYARQARLISSLLNERTLPAGAVECSTVHRFQGNERDLVIFDTVDTAPMKPGILLADSSKGSAAPNIINVSISRARGKLILIADVNYFQQRAPHTTIVRVLNAAIKAGQVHSL